MPRYIEETVQKIIEMKEEDLREIFERVKETFLADWKNYYYEQSYQQALAIFETLMIDKATPKSAQREVLESFSYEKFKEYQQGWLKSGK